MCRSIYTAVVLLMIMHCSHLGLANRAPIHPPRVRNGHKGKGTLSAFSLSDVSDQAQEAADDPPDSTSMVWEHPRITTSDSDLTTEGKYCETGAERMAKEYSDFRGGKQFCASLDPEDPMDDLTDEKRKKLVDEIIPEVRKLLAEKMILRRQSGKRTVPTFEENNICANFGIPENHKNDGLENTDMVIYIAAGPMPDSYKESALWAEHCNAGDNHPIAIAMNFNPRNISATENLAESAVKEVMKALKVKDCVEDGDKTFTEDEKAKKPLNVNCVSNSCDETGALKLQKKEDDKWYDCTKGTKEAQPKEVTQNSETVTERAEEELQKSENAVPLAEKWKPIRVATSTLDLDDNKKYCPDSDDRSTPTRNDMKGDTTHCNFSANKSISDAFNEDKRKIVKEQILPEIQKAFANGPLILQTEGSMVIPESVGEKCSKFNIPTDHTKSGVGNADVMLYISAAPLKKNEDEEEEEENKRSVEDTHVDEAAVWAMPCATLNGRMVAIAVNFNPAKIMDTANTITAAKKEISLALGTSDCPNASNAVLFGGASDTDGASKSICASVKCEGGEKIMVQKKDTDEWKECVGGEDIPFDDQSVDVKCPQYSDMCAAAQQAIVEGHQIEGDHPKSEPLKSEGGNELQNTHQKENQEVHETVEESVNESSISSPPTVKEPASPELPSEATPPLQSPIANSEESVASETDVTQENTPGESVTPDTQNNADGADKKLTHEAIPDPPAKEVGEAESAEPSEPNERQETHTDTSEEQPAIPKEEVKEPPPTEQEGEREALPDGTGDPPVPEETESHPPRTTNTHNKPDEEDVVNKTELDEQSVSGEATDARKREGDTKLPEEKSADKEDEQPTPIKKPDAETSHSSSGLDEAKQPSLDINITSQNDTKPLSNESETTKAASSNGETAATESNNEETAASPSNDMPLDHHDKRSSLRSLLSGGNMDGSLKAQCVLSLTAIVLSFVLATVY